ncbi:MAG: DUF1501 domain-containing protein [Reinekea sp.]|jgi:uncharacterized protein (DUF1501 family)
MNRREFLKNVGASGMVLVAPTTLSSKASAAELAPVGKYFVYAHLGGGWEPTTFCNPKGNQLRGNVGANLGIDAGSVRNAGSPVNRYPASAIRKAADIYTGSASISSEMAYAPYLGTFNRSGPNGELDDGAANEGLTTRHIQKILSGDYDAGSETLTAESDATFDWKVSKTAAEIQANAKRILESMASNGNSSMTVDLNDITSELTDRNLDNAVSGGNPSGNYFVYDAFVCLYADLMRVLNGVDNRTNSHSTGTQYADTGSMAMGYPDFSALYSAVKGADRPLAWMTDGSGNNESAGLVARSSAADADIFDILADPTRDRDADLNQHMTSSFRPFLDRANAARERLQAQQENLPLRRQYQDQLYLVRAQGSQFTDTANVINQPEPGTLAEEVLKAANSGTQRHMRVGAAGFSTGMASSMQVGFGGFDTHGDHDNNHYPRIRRVLVDLHFLFRALEAYGVLNQTTIVVGSDFGRTPWYNDGDGKDHWAVTSYLLFGNGVSGGTSVQATNGLVEARNVNTSNLQAVSSGGTLMTASHLHLALRKFAGIQNHEYSLEFPIDAEDMPMLG